MRSTTVIRTIAALALLGIVTPAVAELQNVAVGGSLRIRGNFVDFDEFKGADTGDFAAVEQRTRVNVKADFTDQVSTFIELDSYDVWGEDFRSNYLTGLDGRVASADDVEVYQAYIDVQNLWDTPLSARIGRQELKLGSGWLAGVNGTAPFYTGLSFDALKLAYATEQFSVAAVAAKLAERSGIEEDGDINLYGVYASYTGIEDVVLDAYWLYIRDAANFRGGLDAHVFGLRGAGNAGAFDFEAEAAYQLQDWERKDVFRVDGETKSDALGGNLVAGYTFDAAYTPRVYAGGAYFSGNDDDLAFNRLFSDRKYSLILDTQANLSNIWLVHGGLSINPTESLKLTASVGYIAALDGREIARFLWWSEDSDKPLGVEAGLRADYAYSEDLSFAVGYSHLFALDGLDDGNFVPNNGAALAFSEDADYLYAETQISF